MNRITVTDNGPLEFQGEMEIVTADGQALSKGTQATFCRCGHSAEKPFCDGSHEAVGFKDEAALVTSQPSAETVSGVLRVVLRPNGPLRLEGPCEVCDARGRILYAGQQTALCRCGHSHSKPFCDGTHRHTGFGA